MSQYKGERSSSWVMNYLLPHCVVVGIVVVMIVVVTYLVVGEVREDKVEPQLQTWACNETRFAVIQFRIFRATYLRGVERNKSKGGVTGQ